MAVSDKPQSILGFPIVEADLGVSTKDIQLMSFGDWAKSVIDRQRGLPDFAWPCNVEKLYKLGRSAGLTEREITGEINGLPAELNGDRDVGPLIAKWSQIGGRI